MKDGDNLPISAAGIQRDLHEVLFEPGLAHHVSEVILDANPRVVDSIVPSQLTQAEADQANKRQLEAGRPPLYLHWEEVLKLTEPKRRMLGRISFLNVW